VLVDVLMISGDTFFCAPCSLAQEDREVSRWEREVAGGEGWCDEDEELGGFRGVETTRGEEGISEEGERLLGCERGELRGLRG